MSAKRISLTNAQHARIALELIRATDLVSLAAERAANGDDSTTQTLLAAIKDRVRSVEQCLGLPSEGGVSHG
jgi:hypothetical protein